MTSTDITFWVIYQLRKQMGPPLPCGSFQYPRSTLFYQPKVNLRARSHEGSLQSDEKTLGLVARAVTGHQTATLFSTRCRILMTNCGPAVDR
ncbi:unnamed protein product [Clonostachys rhizophaga]|uniref:Uncharacterized protein n=1 Tax=Clonostachys rhizophaga TaxID=160324 RepID=A0A9N9VTV3_9HYPO|nr:unnamed protein product [Clonostachys rhizophaga]